MPAFGKRWTKEELNKLSITDDIAELTLLLPDRTLGAIKKKKLELLYSYSNEWKDEELLEFPLEDKVVNKLILSNIAARIPNKSRDQIWRKMKSIGYVWDKDFQAEITEDNPYPDHGKKWTAEEIALFPVDRNVTAEILEGIQALFPRRKPSSIWPKMKKEGYVWVSEEKEEAAAPEQQSLSKEESYVLSLAHELGFSATTKRGEPSLAPGLKNVQDHREEIAANFNLSKDFNSGELLYALIARISPFPWDSAEYPEVTKAYKDRSRESTLEAAKVLHKALESYING